MAGTVFARLAKTPATVRAQGRRKSCRAHLLSSLLGGHMARIDPKEWYN